MLSASDYLHFPVRHGLRNRLGVALTERTLLSVSPLILLADYAPGPYATETLASLIDSPQNLSALLDLLARERLLCFSWNLSDIGVGEIICLENTGYDGASGTVALKRATRKPFRTYLPVRRAIAPALAELIRLKAPTYPFPFGLMQTSVPFHFVEAPGLELRLQIQEPKRKEWLDTDWLLPASLVNTGLPGVTLSVGTTYAGSTTSELNEFAGALLRVPLQPLATGYNILTALARVTYPRSLRRVRVEFRYVSTPLRRDIVAFIVLTPLNGIKTSRNHRFTCPTPIKIETHSSALLWDPKAELFKNPADGSVDSWYAARLGKLREGLRRFFRFEADPPNQTARLAEELRQIDDAFLSANPRSTVSQAVVPDSLASTMPIPKPAPVFIAPPAKADTPQIAPVPSQAPKLMSAPLTLVVPAFGEERYLVEKADGDFQTHPDGQTVYLSLSKARTLARSLAFTQGSEVKIHRLMLRTEVVEKAGAEDFLVD